MNNDPCGLLLDLSSSGSWWLCSTSTKTTFETLYKPHPFFKGLFCDFVYSHSFALSYISFLYSYTSPSAIMQLPPMEVLLSWPLPNYVDPVSRGPAVLIVNIVTMSIAFFLTMLRLYTRLRITCTPGLDDIFIVVALVWCP